MLNIGELRQDLTSRLARELACEQYTLDEILEKLGLSEEFFAEISADPAFCAQLIRERDAWNAPENMNDRVKFKAGTVVERWLIEAYGRLSDPREDLKDKTQLATLLAKLSGMGMDKANEVTAADKFVVNINLGTAKLHYEKTVEHIGGNTDAVGAIPLA